ncbi:unnamed protein product, partial [Mesorhabditis spiculigera]
MRLPTARYEPYMQKFYESLGRSIGSHPWLYIIALVTFTLISSAGLLRFHQINNARLTFTDSRAPSRYEGRVVEQFLRQNGTLSIVEVLVSARDNGSLLRPDQFRQLQKLARDIRKLTVWDDGSKRRIGFVDLCEPYCQKNDAFDAVTRVIDANLSSVEITYPTTEILGEKVFIANNFYRIRVDLETKRLLDFRTVLLHYFLVHADPSLMLKWENELVKLCYASKRYNFLRVLVVTDFLVAKEVKKLGTDTAPLLSIALAALMVFLCVSSLRYHREESKPVEAVLGGAIPILASVATIGIVSATGLAFQSIVVSTLFLLLAIGVDDVFIMLAAWHRTDRRCRVEERVAATVREAGCSMTVTTVTNLISFGNGVFSSTPVLQTFAIYSTVASAVCFAFQLLLFPAILALTANREIRDDTVANKKRHSCLPDRLEFVKKGGILHDDIFRQLSHWVCSTWMRATVVLFLCIYWSISLYGALQARTELGIQHFADKSSLTAQFKVEHEEVIKSMQTLAIVVQTAGDLRNSTNMERLSSMIRAFETEQYSYGAESTFCWLERYEEFLQFYEKEKFTYMYLPDFLASPAKQHYRGTIKMNESACRVDHPDCIASFLFTTGFTTVSHYNEMHPLIEKWRAISRKYPEFAAVSYTERHMFADQSASLPGVIWETLWSEVFCMGLSFLIFIPDTVSIAAGMFALVSVNLGVFGFLTLWGVHIDPISMAALLMSIGFSVDISAHISYHFYDVKGKTTRDRLETTFLHIGWPTIQGGMATLLAMVFILLRPSYLGIVFLKTVFLVVLFGLLHGLIVLPCFLSLFSTVSVPSQAPPIPKKKHPQPDAMDNQQMTVRNDL